MSSSKTDCGGAITDIEGDIASPGWPRNYSHHLNCTWSLVVPAHKVGEDCWQI